MIYTLKHHVITNMLFVSIMICVKLSAMDDQKLVHPALLNPEIKFVQPKTYPPEASLADCLRDNHHVRVYESLKNSENVLEFTTYGEDALRWIVVPEFSSYEVTEEAWNTLKKALHVLIEIHKITKIMFKIQPEIQRLQKVNEYSCLLDIDYINIAYSVIEKLNISNIEIAYLPDSAIYKEKLYFLYRRKFTISSSKNVIIDTNVKTEFLAGLTDKTGAFFMTQSSEAQKKIYIEVFSYVVSGGVMCFIMLLGLYMYNKMSH